MIKVTKVQQASQEHICDECFRRIDYGEEYLRVVQFLEWADVGMAPPDLDRADSADIFRQVVRHPNSTILKSHLEGSCLS